MHDVHERLEAFGHLSIRASHRATLEVTKDSSITKAADCIVAVSATKGLRELSQSFKEMVRRPSVEVVLRLSAGGEAFQVVGSGSDSLTLSHPTDIVCRRSGYIDDRTLMISSDKAALDIPRSMVDILRRPSEKVEVTLIARPRLEGSKRTCRPVRF